MMTKLTQSLKSLFPWNTSEKELNVSLKSKSINDENPQKIFTQKNGAQFLLYTIAGFLFVMAGAITTITINSLASKTLEPLSQAQTKKGSEVFGFAPHWTFNRLDNVDFEVLTTFAYFGVELDKDGNLDRQGKGYEVFKSEKATEVFEKAHRNGTRVLLTITQMKNEPILAFLDSPTAQQNAINQIVEEVNSRGIDGINMDIEYIGNPGTEYRQKFSDFMSALNSQMDAQIPNSYLSVSVYASAMKEPKLYDVKSIGQNVDTVFMMAYDFATTGSSNAIPTAPLYGYKEGKYWYDISTAVDAFTEVMPAEKLVLGVPWYGYNYAVKEPTIKTATNKGYTSYYKKGRKTYSQFNAYKNYAQTYSIVSNRVNAETEGITEFQEGFDEMGKVSWKAYYVPSDGTWRMIFIDDPKSLSYKYDFAKEKKLAGVGMWALGFEEGQPEMWALLKEKFGTKNFADAKLVTGKVN